MCSVNTVGLLIAPPSSPWNALWDERRPKGSQGSKEEGERSLGADIKIINSGLRARPTSEPRWAATSSSLSSHFAYEIYRAHNGHPLLCLWYCFLSLLFISNQSRCVGGSDQLSTWAWWEPLMQLCAGGCWLLLFVLYLSLITSYTPAVRFTAFKCICVFVLQAWVFSDDRNQLVRGLLSFLKICFANVFRDSVLNQYIC